ncbi:hypothetical protein [Parablautia muri]|uniref:Uncharacterized protein n=1 Tax=Parablautia muri TaxID=2320879 RepID=A0A9X5BHT1_9FIRM|nr:hypothetical protein [Parablautia muri]NBJ94351.1 hypothetical protein [Parablautia muri]
MDNFMDKVTQKLNSQEIIKANAAADAAALENLEKQLSLFKEQMEKYDACLQEMRKLNLKNIESAQGVHELAKKANDTLDHAAGEVEAVSVSKIKETSEISIASINQLLDESLAKISEIKENSEALEKASADMNESMSGLQEKLEGRFTNMEDYMHTDNVKVYRNVQAAMIEELKKQTTELKEEQIKASENSKVMLPFMIITMAVTIANLAVTIASVLGFF